MEIKYILVTGGTGLVGSAIKSIISDNENEKWIFVNSKDADLTNYFATKKLFKKYKPTHVIHLAGMVGGLFQNLNDNLDFFRQNMLINDNVLLCCFQFNVKKVISCLSTCIFSDKIEFPTNEDGLHLNEPHFSNFGYSYSKRMIDVLNRAYFEKHGCLFTSIIPCNVFGPHDNFNLNKSHVIPALIHKIYNAKNNDEPLIIYGTGKPKRQFIYSKDLAKLIIWVLKNYDSILPIILAPNEEEEISISDAVNVIIKTSNFKGEIKYDITKSDGVYKKTVSNAKLTSLYKNFKFTPFKKAMKETVNWFEENYEIARK